MDRMTMTIDGMTCAHCVSHVTKALKELEGVDVEQVKIGEATVAYDPSATSEERITQAVADEGYLVTATSR
jgi:copper chaperone CopZ